MTRWLVTGAGGMLGTDLVAALTSRGEPVTRMDRASLDITRVRPIPSSALTRPAPRPAYSVLGHDAWARLAVPPIGEWRTALHHAFPETPRRPAGCRSDRFPG